MVRALAIDECSLREFEHRSADLAGVEFDLAGLRRRDRQSPLMDVRHHSGLGHQRRAH